MASSLLVILACPYNLIVRNKIPPILLNITISIIESLESLESNTLNVSYLNTQMPYLKK